MKLGPISFPETSVNNYHYLLRNNEEESNFHRLRSRSLKSDKVNFFPTYRVSQEEGARLQEGVPYVKVYRYNPKHLCP